MMDTGGVYRRGASITSSFASPHGDRSHAYTSTPPASQTLATSTPLLAALDYASVNQKLDQLLFLYLEEEKEKGAASSLTEKVHEVMERQEEAPAKKEQATEGKLSYKIPRDLLVRTLNMRYG